MLLRIGIPVPTSADLEYNRVNQPDYAEAVRRAGGEPVWLPLTAGPAGWGALAAECDGFLLTGSPADVDPALYGERRDRATAPADRLREETDAELLEVAASSGKPVLAVCYGLQRLNVWCGGTLVQDLAPLPVPHAAGRQVGVAHTVAVARRSLLAGLLGEAEAPGSGEFRTLPVNSSHHQAVSRAGEGLTVVARCGQDGVVEAVEGRLGQATVVGVQWHPERSVETSAGSRALFRWLVAAAEDARTMPGME